MKERLSRREFVGFLRSLWVKTLGLIVSVTMIPALFRSSVRAAEQRVIAIADYPELQKIGGYKAFTAGPPFIVIREGESEYRALTLTCTHLGCTVNWFSSKGIFSCPCHGSQYDKDGKRFGGPGTGNLRVLETEYRSDTGEVIVSL
jgi:cytochrome b6-f complex iron-sulfur subunit